MTTEWYEWTEAEAFSRWDALLTTLPDYNMYQAYGWGEFKRQKGWRLRRGSVMIDGVTEALAQCLIREIRAVRAAIIWVPGGPVGSLAGRWGLGEALRKVYRGWRICLRSHMLGEGQAEETRAMAAAGWVQPMARLAPSLSVHVDLSLDDAARRAALTANWRHNLTRGQRRGAAIEVWGTGSPLEPIYAVYQDMTRLKGIKPAMSFDDLKTIRAIFGGAFTLAVAVEGRGAPCAVRAFVKVGTRGQDFLAGVSEKGRQSYGNYPLMWRLLELAREQGVCLYDMNGADPKRAAGIFNFKQGLGGRIVPLLGEWEWAPSRVLQWGANLMIRGMRSGY